MAQIVPSKAAPIAFGNSTRPDRNWTQAVLPGDASRPWNPSLLLVRGKDPIRVPSMARFLAPGLKCVGLRPVHLAPGHAALILAGSLLAL